jgi:hypothetical protein
VLSGPASGEPVAAPELVPVATVPVLDPLEPVAAPELDPEPLSVLDPLDPEPLPVLPLEPPEFDDPHATSQPAEAIAMAAATGPRVRETLRPLSPVPRAKAPLELRLVISTPSKKKKEIDDTTRPRSAQ